MNSILNKCKVAGNGIYIPKEFIEDWYDKLDDRHLNYALTHPEGLFTQGRIVGGMDVLKDLLDAINEINDY